MSCAVCSSLNEAEFPAEMMIHFSDPARAGKPDVFAVAQVSICLDCGASKFKTPVRELRLLRDGNARPAAA
jgi:hypothetical protein